MGWYPAKICAAAIIILAVGVSPACPAELYLKLAGKRTAGKSVSGNWSASNCYGTLQAALAAMKGGDTLVIDDGTYMGAANSIDRHHRPPSGTRSATTVIRARSIPGLDGVPVNQPCRVRFDGRSGAVFNDDGKSNDVQYVKFWGIKWDGVGLPDGWNHLYFKQCAFQGISDGNSAVLSLSGRNNLVEDCVMYGKGRYKVLFYDISRTGIYGNNLCRRCVARHDWAKKEDPTPDPIATFVSYLNRGSGFLNCIDIDSNKPAYWMNDPGEFNGAFSQPVDDSGSGPHSMMVRGSIVINSAMGVGWGATPAPGVGSALNDYTDVAGIKVAGGINLRGGGTVTRLTLVDVGRRNFTYRSDTQRSQILQGDEGINSWDRTVSVSDSIMRGIAGPALKKGAKGAHVNLFMTGAVGAASQVLKSDPFRNGLRFPVRVEDHTQLSSAGKNGGPLGARILKRLGKDGASKGNADWDTEQGPLWPWPLEGWIQAEMRTSDYTAFCAPYAGTARACPESFRSDAYRGFAAPGQTLTGYIWEAFGNRLPAEIGAER